MLAIIRLLQQMNPYEPPSSVSTPLHSEPSVRVPLLIRVTVGFATSLITCWWFSTNVVPTLAAPLPSFCIMIVVVMLLGLMPAGYGKWDGLFGIWLLTLVVCFSFFVWRIYSPSIAPLERTPAFVLFILVFGGIPGGVFTTVYALSRSFSKWLFCHCLLNETNGPVTPSE
jgi:hypothetical protein